MRSRRYVLGSVAACFLLPLPGCQTQPQPARIPPLPVNGLAYIGLNAPILTRSGDLLIAEINRLVQAGATTIRLAINSPGGDIDVAQRIVDTMGQLHAARGVSFEAYNIGLVASAASYVFLNAQKRYANPRSAFLFHAAGMVSSGLVSAERLREQAAKIEAYERTVRATMKARTRLKDGEIDVYLHRTVLLSPDDAQRDGVIDAIQAFPSTAGITVAVIGTAPAATGAVPGPAAPTGTTAGNR